MSEQDWNPTDEDTWLSNAARELFGFPVVYYKSLADYIKTPRQWNVSPNSKSLQPYQLETLKNFGVDWGSENKPKWNGEIIISEGALRHMKQPISEHRVCPYCGKEGVVETVLALYEDTGAFHVCPIKHYTK